MKNIELHFVSHLHAWLSKKKALPLIQVIIGPRQVGKTTGIKLLLKKLRVSQYHYAAADGLLPHDHAWFMQQWQIAKQKKRLSLLVIDEIQNIENWPHLIKQLWDGQADDNYPIKLILLGSSSLSIQRGLTESLAGRFQLHRVYHWNADESKRAYNLSFDDYLLYGGYPGSYPLISSQHEWLSYIKHSIIDMVVGKDVLLNNRVKSPSLFKQCTELICSYPAQEISYTKLLGQLQSKGNTDQIKYYLELLEGAFLIKQLFKFSPKPVLTRRSSPKLLPLCPALFSVRVDADLNASDKGRMFELVVGNSLHRLPCQLFYWRDKQYELDYVCQYGKMVLAIEVKTHMPKKVSGLNRFMATHPKAIPFIITLENFNDMMQQITEMIVP